MATADTGFDDHIVGGGFRAAAPLAITACAGILIGLGVADIRDQPDFGFDEWVDRQFDSTPGFTPQAPLIEVEGYSPVVPGMLILDMNGDGNPMSQQEMDYLAGVLGHLGYSGESVVVVLHPTLIDEVDSAIRRIHSGEDPGIVIGSLSDSGKFAYRSVADGINEGRNVVMTDKSATKIRQVRQIELMGGPGTWH